MKHFLSLFRVTVFLLLFFCISQMVHAFYLGSSGRFIPNWECMINDKTGYTHTGKCYLLVSKGKTFISSASRDHVNMEIGAASKSVGFYDLKEFTLLEKPRRYDVQFILRDETRIINGTFSPSLDFRLFDFSEYDHWIVVDGARIRLQDINWPIRIKIK